MHLRSNSIILSTDPPSFPLFQRLAQLVCVEGIVTRCSLVRPKVVRSVHYCPAKQGHVVRDYRDATCISIGLEAGGRPMLPTNSTYPSKDKDGNPLETEYGLSTYKDHQSVTIQEMPERAPLGQMPRSVSLVFEYDLVVGREGGREVCGGVGGDREESSYSLLRSCWSLTPPPPPSLSPSLPLPSSSDRTGSSLETASSAWASTRLSQASIR